MRTGSRFNAAASLLLALIHWSGAADAVPIVEAEVQAIAGLLRIDEFERGDSQEGAVAIAQQPTGPERAAGTAVANAGLGRLSITASARATRSRLSDRNPGNAIVRSRAFFRADDIVLRCDPLFNPGLCVEGVDTSVPAALRLQTSGVVYFGGFNVFGETTFLRMRGTLPGGDFGVTMISPIIGNIRIDSVSGGTVIGSTFVAVPACTLGDIHVVEPTPGFVNFPGLPRNDISNVLRTEGCDFFQTSLFDLPLFTPIPLTLELLAEGSAGAGSPFSSAESTSDFPNSASLPLSGPVFDRV